MRNALRRERGFSLIELMVALAIGSFLIAGAVVVYSNSRRTYSVNETTARLEENARYVFSIIEPDLQLAGYYGYFNTALDFKYIAGGSTAAPISASNMTPASGALPLGAAQACGNNFAVNVLVSVEGANNAYGLACPPQPATGALANTDTLTIRRAGTQPQAAGTAGTVQVLASRLSNTGQFILSDGALPPAPALAPNIVELRNLIVNTYYIAADSNNRVGQNIPALRRKTLINGPAFDDNEIMSGVEDLQVQFGIDTGDYDGDGVIDPGRDDDGNGIPDAPLGIATRYVNPNFPGIQNFQIVSVRIWIMMRSEQPEVGFIDSKTYTYADRPARTPNDNFRRLLVMRTIQLRNSRTL